MARESDRDRPASALVSSAPWAQELKGAIDSGRTGKKVEFSDLGAAPLGTDDEAAGTPDTAVRVATAIRQELKQCRSRTRPRPLSPNIQIYRPQLTSVLSILNRITGVLLSVGAVVLVVWLIAAASGPQTYRIVQSAIASSIGQIVLFAATFAFFLHISGGIRHLIWDTVHGFELRSIYISGWLVVASSVVLTLAAWVPRLLMKG